MSAPITPAPAGNGPAAVVNRTEAEQFARMLFEGLDGHVNLRAIEEPAPSGRKPLVRQRWIPIDDRLPDAIGGYVEECARDGFAAYVLPAAVRNGGGGLEDIICTRALVADFDSGDIDSNIGRLVELLGEPWMVVNSGGVTGVGHSKAHVYYRVEPEVRRDDGAAFLSLAELRATLARRFGADEKVGRNPAQILRVPGSIHRKAEPRAVSFRSVNPASRPLDTESSKSVAAPESPSNVVQLYDFDFNNDDPSVSVDRALTAPVHAEGVDGITRFDAAGKAIGHFLRMVREGRYSVEDAWRAVCEWNAATLVPPWDESRLRGDFERLAKADIKTKGPLPSALPAAPPTEWSIADWSIDRFSAPAPERKWLVEGLIPAGTAGVFAAAGDAGKSMLSVWLAYLVGCYPETVEPSLDAPRFFGQPVTARGAAVVLTAEDDAEEVHRRVEKLDKAGLRGNGKQRVFVVPMPNVGGVRSIIADDPQGAAPTPFWHDLKAKLCAIPDLRLVVLDPLAAFATAEVETNNAAAAVLMGMLGELATATGAAVLITHHITKNVAPATLKQGRDVIRGASAIVNGGRWALVLWEADEDSAQKVLQDLGQAPRAAKRQGGVVYFGGLAKGNAPGEKVLRTFVRSEASGLLEDVTDTLRTSQPSTEECDQILHRDLCEMRGKDPRFSFTSGKSKLWETFGPIARRHALPITKDGKRRGFVGVEEVFERMMAAGLIAKTAETGSATRYEPVADS